MTHSFYCLFYTFNGISHALDFTGDTEIRGAVESNEGIDTEAFAEHVARIVSVESDCLITGYGSYKFLADEIKVLTLESLQVLYDIAVVQQEQQIELGAIAVFSRHIGIMNFTQEYFAAAYVGVYESLEAYGEEFLLSTAGEQFNALMQAVIGEQPDPSSTPFAQWIADLKVHNGDINPYKVDSETVYIFQPA